MPLSFSFAFISTICNYPFVLRVALPYPRCLALLGFYGVSALSHPICMERLFPYVTIGVLSFQVMLKADEGP